MSTTVSGKSGTWRNWAGNVTARPVREVTPASVDELSAAVRKAAEDGLTVKAVGTGHSFTAAAATDGVLIRPQLLTGIRKIDRAAMTVTVEAGTPLKRLNMALVREGLSLTNMGDIMEQTVSGATSTGTHGTGRDSASIAAQITGLELVTADGSVLSCSENENPEIFAAARIGIGALGIVTAITFSVEPVFLLTAREEPMTFDKVTADFEELFTENEHFEFYWFPHTGNCNTKRNNRSAGPENPVGPVRGWIEDEFLSNGVFQVANLLGRAVPAAIPSIAGLSSRALSARTYTDIPYKVFTSAPRAVRGDGVRRTARGPRRDAARAEVDGRQLAPAGQLPRGGADRARGRHHPLHGVRTGECVHRRPHVQGYPYQAYFTAAERIFTAHEGRPHWGKVHTRDAEYFSKVYPRFGEFTELRDRLDPDRRFANDYLRRVLGS